MDLFTQEISKQLWGANYISDPVLDPGDRTVNRGENNTELPELNFSQRRQTIDIVTKYVVRYVRRQSVL